MTTQQRNTDIVTDSTAVATMVAWPAALLTTIAAGLLMLASVIGSANAAHHAKVDVVDTAAGAGTFSTLVTAVEAAGLVDTLKGEGPFTVFAPTDEAFAKIPEDQLNGLLADKEALTDVLTYHVVAGKVMAADVANLDKAETVQGGELMIETEGSSVKVNGATVVQTDIEASNGVIHVIDTVLMPQ